jgi:hypothetical protein
VASARQAPTASATPARWRRDAAGRDTLTSRCCPTQTLGDSRSATSTTGLAGGPRTPLRGHSRSATNCEGCPCSDSSAFRPGRIARHGSDHYLHRFPTRPTPGRRKNTGNLGQPPHRGHTVQRMDDDVGIEQPLHGFGGSLLVPAARASRMMREMSSADSSFQPPPSAQVRAHRMRRIAPQLRQRFFQRLRNSCLRCGRWIVSGSQA